MAASLTKGGSTGSVLGDRKADLVRSVDSSNKTATRTPRAGGGSFLRLFGRCQQHMYVSRCVCFRYRSGA